MCVNYLRPQAIFLRFMNLINREQHIESIHFAIKQISMKKNRILWMSALVLTMAGLSSCSSDDDINVDKNGKDGSTEVRSGSLGDNVLEIKEVYGKTETCRIYNAICGISDQIWVTGPGNNTYVDFPMKFTASIKNSSHFTGLHLGIENRENRRIEDMAVGTSYSTFHYNPQNKLSFSIWGDTYYPSHGAWSGGIKVVGKRTDADGRVFITISLQDLETCAYDQNDYLHTYLLNGEIEFRICENGLYPKPKENAIDLKSMSYPPSDELDFFMMDALHSNESQGRRTFFSEAAEEEKLLIINSEEEFREAYKGDKELPQTGINFNHCSLVIGRTYGEHGGISLGGFELTDNGDTYQLDVTLNNNTNPEYAYTAAFIDLYFWKIYPKMEKKPVVFNRIRKDVNIDPLDVYKRIRNRWILTSYSDADGKFYQLERDDERFSIEFMENGRIESRNNRNTFFGTYMIPFVGKRAYYEDIDHGIINSWDWTGTMVGDDDPVSKQFMHISNATQFKLVTSLSLTLYVSPKEFYVFRNEDM